MLDKGRIVETGTHDELVARNGTYATLWRLETGERGGEGGILQAGAI